MPLTAHDEWTEQEQAVSKRRWLVLGRLKPAAGFDQAQAEITTIAARLAKQYPETNQGKDVRVLPLHQLITGSARSPLSVLLGAVAFVLLIACTNVANLVLARGAAREREFAVRAALGAGRGRLMRQLLTESIVLALAAGLAGLLLAVAGMRALVTLGPLDIPRLDETRIDPMVFAFTAAISLLTGILLGLAPAMRVSA